MGLAAPTGLDLYGLVTEDGPGNTAVADYLGWPWPAHSVSYPQQPTTALPVLRVPSSLFGHVPLHW